MIKSLWRHSNIPRKKNENVDKGDFSVNTELKESDGKIPICLLKERCTVKLPCQ